MASDDPSSTSSSFSKTFLEIRKSLKEDAPTNSVASGGVSGLTGIPPVPSKIMPILRRKKKKTMPEEVEAGPHIGTIVKKISSAAARLNKKTKFPLDRYREVQGRLYRHPPSGPRAKASRAAYEVMHKKGYDPYFDPNEENENTYAFHTAGKKLPTKPRKVQDMMPADEYPPHPAINEEIEDYVVAFTLPVFIRTLEIARETLKDDDELHMFVEDLVNLQGDDILTMQDVEEVFAKYKGD